MPDEIGELYGRAGAVELTKEFLTRPQADGPARSRQQPVLVFTGPHGSGKTALLAKLEAWLEPLAPYARIDCATDDLRSSPRVLSALVFELNRTAGRYGRLAGAAGSFGFDPVTGNPTGRDFPVLELTPGGGLKLLGVYPLPAPAAGQ